MALLPTQEQLKEYADKWLQGTITQEEKEIFEKWYNEEAQGPVDWSDDENEDQLKERIFNKLDKELGDDKTDIFLDKHKKNRWWRVAAAVAALFILSFAILKWSGKKAQQDLVRNEPVPDKPILDKTTGYTRHLTLPDGSTVILRANSKLDFSGSFSGNAREVILVGEAYFDIKHDEKRPFIIHTGDIKTTVLGTAFNINAYPDAKKITVSVTRGKVKVEKNEKVLAILMPDQQVTYNTSKETEPAQQEVNATAIVTDWTKQDMAFEDVSFEKIVLLLNRRYNVNINFKNPALQNCTIKAFFTGTESLEKVLDVLCIISNASYTTNDNKNILLDGKGCEENEGE